jgi:hypothetical protein
LTALNRTDVLTTPNSLPRDHLHRVIRANIRRLRQLDHLANAKSDSGRCELVSDVARELHGFLMIDEEVLRSALLRESGISQ